MIRSLQPLLKKIINTIDVIASIVGCFIGIFIIFFSFFGIINQYTIGFTILFASLLYLFLKPRLIEDKFHGLFVSFRQKKALDILFFILIGIISIIWYTQLYSRPIEYFILISLLAGLISLDILTNKKENSVLPILLKIFFLAIMIRAGIYYNFPSIMGYDAFIHTKIANLISITGFIPPFDISNKYINYPIFHIFISMTKILSFIDIKDAIFFSIGVISIISILFIFILVNRFAGPRIGFLSALIIIFSNQIITTGITNITAGSLVLCNFMMILYLLLYRKNGSFIFTVILFLITATMILTHQLSTFVVLMSVVLITIGFILFEFSFKSTKKNPIYLYYLPFFAISMIFYWMSTPAYNKQSFFDTILGPLIDVLEFGGRYGSDMLIVGTEYSLPFIEIVLLQASYLAIPFFAIGGVYLWLSKKNAKKFSIAIAGLALFFLIYSVPLLGIRNLLTARWMPFLTIFLGILAAAYIISCVNLVKSNPRKIVIMFMVITIFSFLMIITPGINKDNPLVAKDTTPRNQYTFNEISAIVTIQSIHDGRVFVDPSFVNAILFYGGNFTIEDQKKMTGIFSSFQSDTELLKIANDPGSLIILRRITLIEPITLKASELIGDTYTAPLSKSVFDNIENSHYQNLIFTNGNVIAYYSG